MGEPRTLPGIIASCAPAVVNAANEDNRDRRRASPGVVLQGLVSQFDGFTLVPFSGVRVNWGPGGSAYNFIITPRDLDRRVARGGFEVLRCFRKVRWQIPIFRHYPF